MDATRSLVYKVKRVGPRTLPWGTPEDTEQRLDLFPFKTVYCKLDVRLYAPWTLSHGYNIEKGRGVEM